MIKCKCGVKLFNDDIVDNIYDKKKLKESLEYKYRLCSNFLRMKAITHYIYRCPNCYKTKKVKV